jgi:hypothetical protein
MYKIERPRLACLFLFYRHHQPVFPNGKPDSRRGHFRAQILS